LQSTQLSLATADTTTRRKKTLQNGHRQMVVARGDMPPARTQARSRVGIDGFTSGHGGEGGTLASGSQRGARSTSRGGRCSPPTGIQVAGQQREPGSQHQLLRGQRAAPVTRSRYRPQHPANSFSHHPKMINGATSAPNGSRRRRSERKQHPPVANSAPGPDGRDRELRGDHLVPPTTNSTMVQQLRRRQKHKPGPLKTPTATGPAFTWKRST